MNLAQQLRPLYDQLTKLLGERSKAGVRGRLDLTKKIKALN